MFFADRIEAIQSNQNSSVSIVQRGPNSPMVYSSTIKLMQAGFQEVMDTEKMLVGWIHQFQERRLLPY